MLFNSASQVKMTCYKFLKTLGATDGEPRLLFGSTNFMAYVFSSFLEGFQSTVIV